MPHPLLMVSRVLGDRAMAKDNGSTPALSIWLGYAMKRLRRSHAKRNHQRPATHASKLRR